MNFNSKTATAAIKCLRTHIDRHWSDRYLFYLAAFPALKWWKLLG